MKEIEKLVEEEIEPLIRILALGNLKLRLKLLLKLVRKRQGVRRVLRAISQIIYFESCRRKMGPERFSELINKTLINFPKRIDRWFDYQIRYLLEMLDLEEDDN